MSTLDLARELRLRRAGRDWRGGCPVCGYDAFSLSVQDGRTLWWCASCQDQAAVTAAVRQAAGCDWIPPSPPGRPPDGDAAAGRTARALAIWDAATPLRGTPAERYLAERGLAGETSAALRYHSALRHPNAAGTFPGMVALIVSTITGAPVAIHRTYLRHDGAAKADLDPAKASLGPMKAGAIMLHPPRAGAASVIGEGIESALSAGRLLGAPAWAAVAAGNLKEIVPPAEPSDIILAADADPVGQREAWAAARRWRALGRRVRVATPDQPGDDFNDLLRARMAREACNAG